MPKDIIDPNEIEKNTSSWFLLSARDPDGEFIYPISMDELTRSMRVNNWVYSTSLLRWVKMEQPVINIGDLTVTMGDVEALLADNYWKRSKYFLDVSDNYEYICRNTDIDAAYADTDWYCWKFVYDGNNNAIDSEGPRLGAVTSAPSGLAWNI